MPITPIAPIAASMPIFGGIGDLYGKIPLCVGGASPRSAADAVLGGAGEAGIEQSGQDRDGEVFVARAPIGMRRE